MTPRDDRLAGLSSAEPWDVVVIGGGATGLGAAVDAASRGYRTLLLERYDFASGTSSRSTKLIHGGVRYLAQGNIPLVREALRERGLLLRNAPHLVADRGFLVPSYRWGTRAYYGMGLWLYDRLSGKLGMGRSRLVGRDEALGLVATLEPQRLRGGVLYRDGQFDDARLAVALARTAENLGATVLNALAVTGLNKNKAGRIEGLSAHDAESGETFSIRARSVINATGVFADTIRRMDDPQQPTVLTPSQGAHLVLDRKFLPGETALMVPKTDDGRVLFAIPWQGRVLVGTTDTPVREVSTEPGPLPEELDFLLRNSGRYLATRPTSGDILSAFAGLRPLFRSGGGSSSATSKVSREHATLVSTSGLVTITGGKWTTYRRMGQDAVDKAAAVGGLATAPSNTAELRLHGWVESPDRSPLGWLGSDGPAFRRLLEEQPGSREPIHPELPYLSGEIVWACRFEFARTVEDVLARRTRSLLLNARAAAEAAEKVARIMAIECHRDDSWIDAQVEAFRSLAAGYIPGA